jgi:hypothetical protein
MAIFAEILNKDHYDGVTLPVKLQSCGEGVLSLPPNFQKRDVVAGVSKRVMLVLANLRRGNDQNYKWGRQREDDPFWHCGREFDGSGLFLVESELMCNFQSVLLLANG